MKKILKTLIAVVLVIPMLFSVACNKNNDNSSNGNSSSTSIEESTPTPAPTPVTSTTYKFATINEDRLSNPASSTPYHDGKIIVYSNNTVEVELVENSEYITEITKLKGTFTTTGEIINMTITESATLENYAFGQAVYTATTTPEEATSSFLSIVDLKFINNRNYIVVTALKMLPMVFVKEGYTPTEKEFVTTTSILNAMDLDNLSHSTYFSMCIAFGGVLTVTNESGTLYYNNIDAERITKYDGITFDNNGYLVAGKYTEPKIYVDENETETATTEDDTIYTINEFNVKPVSSSVTLYSYDGSTYTAINKAITTKGKTLAQFIEESKLYYSLDNGSTHQPITAEMVSGFDTSEITQIEEYAGFITITIPVDGDDPIAHSLTFIVRDSVVSIEQISIVDTHQNEVNFFSMPKNTVIETFLTNYNVRIYYSNNTSTLLEFSDSKITLGSVDTSITGYTKINFTYTENEVDYSASYLIAVTDETHNAPYRYVLKDNSTYSDYYHCILDLSTPEGKEAAANTLNNLEIEVYAQYFDGTYSTTSIATLDFNELCGIETFTADIVELLTGYNYYYYSAEIDVVGEGFESFKYDSICTIVI